MRLIVRGKQDADVEFGAKVEMSVVNGSQRSCASKAHPSEQPPEQRVLNSYAKSLYLDGR